MRTEAETRQGVKLDLTDCPLEYSATKMQLPDAQAKAVQDFEKKCIQRKYKNEHLLMLDENGNVLTETKGGSGNVSADVAAFRAASITTHLHPRPDGRALLGGTFSVGDFEMWTHPVLAGAGAKIERVVSNEGVYTFKRGENFDIDAFVDAYGDVERKLHAEYMEKRYRLVDETHEIGRRFSNGEITRKEMDDELNKINLRDNANFNVELVGLHNALLDMQDQFDYEYGLEGWD